jgi:hypothetical protein
VRRLAAAAGLALGVMSGARAQDVDGRTFADVQIGETVQAGDIVLRAARAYSWTEPTGSGTLVHRLVLSGDVDVTLGSYRFTAARAVVWIERVEVAGRSKVGTGSEGRAPGEGAEGAPAPEPKPVHQVAVYFDRVNDPTAEAGFSQFGDRLLVSALLEGEPSLFADVLHAERPGDTAQDKPFLAEGEARLARFLRAAVSGEFEEAATEPPVPQVPSPPRDPDAPIQPGVSRPYEPGSALDPAAEAGVLRQLPAERLPAIFSPEGLITIAPGDITLVTGEDENALVATGGVVVTYTDAGRVRSLQLSAERAVIFLSPGTLSQLARFTAKDVRGIYLEGDVVATSTERSGTNVLRGPRIYYDVHANKAVLVDAVFHTFDQKTRMPLYARASVLRQTATNQFTGAPMRLSNTSFFEPHLALGASEITVTRRQEPGEPQRTIVDADDLTLRFGQLPFFYWPKFYGDVEHIPLRDVRVENSSDSGFAVKTAWDMNGILGITPEAGDDWQLLVDGYFERGAALGTTATWTRPDRAGSLFAYGIFDDTGTDSLTSGAEKKRDGESRGILLGEQRLDFDANWSLFLEGAYLGDENFTDAFFEPLVETRREFTNAAYLRYLDDNTAFTLLGQANANDFTANEYLLQSRGYSVDRLPEAAYYRVADDLLGGINPGALTWSHDYRVSNMKLNFTEPTIDELGFDTASRAFEAFGISDPNSTLAQQLRARGLGSNDVVRLDTRQEFVYTEQLGPVKLMPFLAARFTGYDQKFEDYSPEADTNYRLWGSAGVRASTEITRIDDSVDSQWLDLYRMRHIITPNLTLWTGGANIDQQDLPVYDENVESIATGSAVRVGVANVWQTQRGGVGRWRSVDWIKWTNDFTFASDDAQRESPVRRFIDFRPEYSQLGNFYTTDFSMQMTDTLAVTGNIVFDFELNQLARTSIGAVFDHTPEFSTGIEARSINVRDETLLDLYALYKLSRKYDARARVTFDTDREDVRSFGVEVRRRFPSVTLGVTASHDNISGESSVGVIMEPKGLETNQDRLRALKSE